MLQLELATDRQDAERPPASSLTGCHAKASAVVSELWAGCAIQRGIYEIAGLLGGYEIEYICEGRCMLCSSVTVCIQAD